MLGFIAVILLARWFPHILAATAVGAAIGVVIGLGYGFLNADPDTRLGLELLVFIVGCVAGAIWLLVRLFRVEQPIVARERREPRL
jgi:hypothetical protein